MWKEGGEAQPITPKPEAKKPEPPKVVLSSTEAKALVEAAIRRQLKKPEGELTKEDLEKVTTLYLGLNQLTDVPKGLEKLTPLEKLDLEGNQLTDVKSLEKLDQLTKLDLDSNHLTDVKGLEKLTQLTELDLRYNRLTDLTGLERLTQLEDLFLRSF